MGDPEVCSKEVCGTTSTLFQCYLRQFEIELDFAPLGDLDAWRRVMGRRTRLLVVEAPSNPLAEVADLAALAVLARSHHGLQAVDNCFCTPALQRPLEVGAVLVVHSANQYIDGQGRCV